MMKVFLILNAAMFFSFSSSGQVLSSTYGITLNVLLSHSVPEASVAQVKEMNRTFYGSMPVSKMNIQLVI
jgi:hypothetical protein